MAADEFRLLTAYIQLEARGYPLLKTRLSAIQASLNKITTDAVLASEAVSRIGVGGRGGASFPQRFAKLTTTSSATFDTLNRQIHRTIANQNRLLASVKATTEAYGKLKFAGISATSPVRRGRRAGPIGTVGPPGTGFTLVGGVRLPSYGVPAIYRGGLPARFVPPPVPPVLRRPPSPYPLAGGTGGLSRLVKGYALYILARRMASLAAEAVVVTAKFEEATVAIKSFAGVKVGTQLIRDLKSFSNQAPVNFLSDVIPSAQKLLAANFDPSEIVEFVKILTNISLASPNSSLDKIVFNLSQIKLKGKASTIDLREFANQGIPIYAALEEAINATRGATAKLTDDELTKFIVKSKVGITEVTNAMKLLGTPRFFGDLISKNRNTAIADIHKMRNAVDDFKLAIGRGLTPTLSELADGLQDAFNPSNLAKLEDFIKNTLGPTLVDMIKIMKFFIDLSATVSEPVSLALEAIQAPGKALIKGAAQVIVAAEEQINDPRNNPFNQKFDPFRFPDVFDKITRDRPVFKNTIGGDTDSEESTRARAIAAKALNIENERARERVERLADATSSLFSADEKRLEKLRNVFEVAKEFNDVDLFSRVRQGLEQISQPGGGDGHSSHALKAVEFGSAEFFRSIASDQFGFGKLNSTMTKGNNIALEANALLKELNIETKKSSSKGVKPNTPQQATVVIPTANVQVTGSPGASTTGRSRTL